MKNYMRPMGGIHKRESMHIAISLALEETMIKYVMHGLEWPPTHPLSVYNDHQTTEKAFPEIKST